MKKRIPSFLAGALAATLVFSLGLTAMAATGNLTGQVTFGGVNVFVGETKGISEEEATTNLKGQEIPSSITYTDAKGGGTVYLPVRALSELLETTVSYEVGTNNIYFEEVISKQTAALMATLVDGDYPKNSKGETYGSGSLAGIVGHEPDLIAAVATNGKEGYIRSEDANKASDPAATQKTIPVYDLDGNVIGEFTISNGTSPEAKRAVEEKIAEMEADRLAQEAESK